MLKATCLSSTLTRKNSINWCTYTNSIELCIGLLQVTSSDAPVLTSLSDVPAEEQPLMYLQEHQCDVPA